VTAVVSGQRVQWKTLFGALYPLLRSAGFEVVKVGEVPFWMERVESIPAPLYRMKELV
jgi:hypothetical protein